VADTSTAELMQNFYRLREEQQLTKAEALRQAQLLLLHGPGDKEEQTSTQPKPLFSDPDPDRPFAHPFYWAPFVLMGNWL
jgi:CHAT domain-containing protein